LTNSPENNVRISGGKIVTRYKKAKASGVEALFLVGYGTSMGTLIRQVREIGYRGHILVASGCMASDVQKAAGEAIRGVFYSDVPFDPAHPNALAAAFASDYERRYGKTPTPFASSVYDGVCLALTALVEAKRSPEGALEYLARTKQFNGVNGTLTILPSRDIIYALAVKRVP
jgi:branched-chain amino acid transport system substrate-binding protein